VVLPQGVAFATIAGMPPEYGLYAAMVPAVVAALYGSSRHLVSGPTTAGSILLLSILSTMAEPGSMDYVRLALTLTFLVGVIELVMGFARLGFLISFISHSVVIGFTAGAAILIATNQLKHFVGVEIPRGLEFDEILVYFFRHLHDINPYVSLVGGATLLSGLLVKRYVRKIPYMIAALLVGSLAAALLGRFLGHEVTRISTVGALPATLPPLSAPDFSFSTIKALAPAALAMTLFALTEAVSIARALAVRSEQAINGSQEFIGQGLSNLLGSFFSAYVATGSFNRSAVNFTAGAITPLAAVFSGVLLVITVIFVAPLAAHIPYAAIAGILFLVAWGLIDFLYIRRTLQVSRADSVVLVVTFLATLFLELEFAILLGVLLSFVVYLGRTSRPGVRVRVPNPNDPHRLFTSDPALPECPQLKIVRIDGSLFFGAVDYVGEQLRALARAYPKQKHLLMLARSINFVDVTGADLITREARTRRAIGGRLYLHQVKEVTLETLQRCGCQDEVGIENVFTSKQEAIAAIFERLDRNICLRCDKRIFLECASLPAPVEEESIPEKRDPQ
jgi:SulP family sulfate permease